jgi:hypothetical protein
MSTDLFNNPSNDYIHPNLAPCPDAGDTYTFEFLGKKNVGITNGSKTLLDMSFADLHQDVTGWAQDKKFIQSQEVVFVAGLTKGVTTKVIVFPINPSGNDFDISVGFSVGYYKNFRYYTTTIHAEGDPINQIGIEDAINIALGASNIGVNLVYDPSKFTFSSAIAGLDFSISTINYDASLNIGYILTPDISAGIPAAKYPNTAMLGYVLKPAYPTSANIPANNWVYINHVPDTLVYYDVSTVDMVTSTRYFKTVDVGMSGASTEEVMSAGDYLNYVDVNNKWDKVGSLQAWITAPDVAGDVVENLITGFYLYNPHDFAIQVDYLLML